MARFRLVKTSGACPEQYDVFQGETQVGYFRLRHGNFRIDAGHRTIAHLYPEGSGEFRDEERERFLIQGCLILGNHLDSEGESVLFEVEDKTGVEV